MLASNSGIASAYREVLGMFLNRVYWPAVEATRLDPNLFDASGYFDGLDRGRRVLKRDEIDRYIALHGRHHYEKVSQAVRRRVGEIVNGRSVEVYDWGAGQGIATMALLDARRDQAWEAGINRIHLIEPSDASLRRAEHNLGTLYVAETQGVAIQSHRGFFEDHRNDDFRTEINALPIHLLSSIVDVEAVNLDSLCQLIRDVTQRREAIVIITTPYNAAAIARVDEAYDKISDGRAVAWGERASADIPNIEVLRCTHGKNPGANIEIQSVTSYERQCHLRGAVDVC